MKAALPILLLGHKAESWVRGSWGRASTSPSPCATMSPQPAWAACSWWPPSVWSLGKPRIQPQELTQAQAPHHHPSRSSQAPQPRLQRTGGAVGRAVKAETAIKASAWETGSWLCSAQRDSFASGCERSRAQLARESRLSSRCRQFCC